jgi:nitrogen fixation protein FixH
MSMNKAKGLAVAIWCAGLVSGPAFAANEDFFTHIHTDKAMANVTVSPGHSGPVEISIQLETVDETPLSAKSVSITLSDPDSGRKLSTMAASRSADDGWNAKTSLGPGKWMLALNIAISDSDHVEVESPILIK